MPSNAALAYDTVSGARVARYDPNWRLPNTVWAPQPGPQIRGLQATGVINEVFFGGTRGGGKGQPLDALVLTPFGYREMGGLEIGSAVCCPDGSHARVIGIYPLGRRQLYRVTFHDGTSTLVTDDHIWLAWNALRSTKRKGRRTSGERSAQLWLTAHIRKLLDTGARFRIPITQPVALTDTSRYPRRPVDPYLLGVLLGDGTITGRKLRICTTDPEIIERIQKGQTLLGPYAYPDRAPEYTLPEPNGVRPHLQRWGLIGTYSHTKFIPEAYLRGTTNERWELLRGLLDTDGWAEEDGDIYYCTTSPQLRDDTAELARSLGAVVTVRYKRTPRKPAHTLRIKLPVPANAFTLQRKRARCAISPPQSMSRLILSIEPEGAAEAQCIKVSHPSGLYITNDCIVTHNTDLLLGDQITGALEWGPWWNGMIVRKKYKDFASIRHRIDELIRLGMPAERSGGETQLGVVRWQNGATVYLQAIPRLDLADDHQGQAYTRVSIDEAPLIPFIGPLVDRLKGCLRSVHGVPTGFLLTGNPGGPGAAQINLMYIEPVPEGTVNRVPGSARVFIRSKLTDNLILCQRDPDYAAQLASIKDPLLRRAWLDGDWTVFIGQAFSLNTDPPPAGHVIEPIWPIPEHVPIYMTFDWGYGKPFSIGWWWVDSLGTLIRCSEWYGWDGNTPDVGLRLTDEQIADGIKEREKAMGIEGRTITRLAGPDCWNKKPDYRGGGQGPSTAMVFSAKGIDLAPGDPDRVLKIRQFRSRLAVDSSTKQPGMLVYNTCRHFIRTIPALTMDDLKPEDVDTDQEDHIYDESCHICMARPIALSDSQILQRHREALREDAIRKLDTPSRAAADEIQHILKQVKEAQEAREDGGMRTW